MALDPVTLGILNHKFSAVTDEMTLNLRRASRSVYVKEAADFGTGLVDLDGHVFAFPASTSVSRDRAYCGATIRAMGTLRDGDVIITNDPYRSGGLATHLPDLHLVQPYFHRGEIVAYGWCFIHFIGHGRPRAGQHFALQRRDLSGRADRRRRSLHHGAGANEELLGIIAANCAHPAPECRRPQGDARRPGDRRKRIGDVVAAAWPGREF